MSDGSEYIHWARTQPPVRFNLAVSGVPEASLADLPVRLDDLSLSPPPTYGYPPLQERLARRLGVSADCIVATTGTSMANYLALDALVEPGDDVLSEQPGYEPLVRAAEHVGARVRRFARRAERGFAMERSEVERMLRELRTLARTAGARVLVDEVYLETLYDRWPWRTAFHLGPEFVATSSLIDRFLSDRVDVTCARSPFGSIAFLRLARGDVNALCTRLREGYETAVVPGRFFDAPDHFRIGLGAPTAVLTEGLARLAEALDESGG